MASVVPPTLTDVQLTLQAGKPVERKLEENTFEASRTLVMTMDYPPVESRTLSALSSSPAETRFAGPANAVGADLADTNNISKITTMQTVEYQPVEPATLSALSSSPADARFSAPTNAATHDLPETNSVSKTIWEARDAIQLFQKRNKEISTSQVVDEKRLRNLGVIAERLQFLQNKVQVLISSNGNAAEITCADFANLTSMNDELLSCITAYQQTIRSKEARKAPERKLEESTFEAAGTTVMTMDYPPLESRTLSALSSSPAEARFAGPTNAAGTDLADTNNISKITTMQTVEYQPVESTTLSALSSSPAETRFAGPTNAVGTDLADANNISKLTEMQTVEYQHEESRTLSALSSSPADARFSAPTNAAAHDLPETNSVSKTLWEARDAIQLFQKRNKAIITSQVVDEKQLRNLGVIAERLRFLQNKVQVLISSNVNGNSTELTAEDLANLTSMNDVLLSCITAYQQTVRSKEARKAPERKLEESTFEAAGTPVMTVEYQNGEQRALLALSSSPAEARFARPTNAAGTDLADANNISNITATRTVESQPVESKRFSAISSSPAEARFAGPTNAVGTDLADANNISNITTMQTVEYQQEASRTLSALSSSPANARFSAPTNAAAADLPETNSISKTIWEARDAIQLFQKRNEKVSRSQVIDEKQLRDLGVVTERLTGLQNRVQVLISSNVNANYTEITGEDLANLTSMNAEMLGCIKTYQALRRKERALSHPWIHLNNGILMKFNEVNSLDFEATHSRGVARMMSVPIVWFYEYRDCFFPCHGICKPDEIRACCNVPLKERHPNNQLMIQRRLNCQTVMSCK
ncbi:unnamed protein product [Dibothriocephalus latus]|uniref:GAT domain-containing protein n=1 Tax=Dibothriocephalus latus TaxID=60516 RepID=A0A3P7NHV9_DIBLA|nr:unnamed protein product [Dibothriocephalus latus]